MTPYQLEIILHHWTGTTQPFQRAHAPLYPGTVEDLVDQGLLRRTDDQMLTGTPLCEAFIDMLCGTPLPELRYVDPRAEASK